MLPIDKCHFPDPRRIATGEIIVCRLCMGEEYALDQVELDYGKLGPEALREYIKEQLRQRIWARVYGELNEEFYRLRHLALVSAQPRDVPELQKYFAHFGRLLRMPEQPKLP